MRSPAPQFPPSVGPRPPRSIRGMRMSRPTLGLAVLAVLALAVLRASAGPPQDARAPVPDAAARAPIAAALRKEFRDDLKSKDAGVKRKLVRTLLDRAAVLKDDPLTRYVLLDEASTV